MNDNSTLITEEILDSTIQTENSVELPFSGDSIIEENKIKITLTPSKRKKTKKINVTIEGIFNINHATVVKGKLHKTNGTF